MKYRGQLKSIQVEIEIFRNEKSLRRAVAKFPAWHDIAPHPLHVRPFSIFQHLGKLISSTTHRRKYANNFFRPVAAVLPLFVLLYFLRRNFLFPPADAACCALLPHAKYNFPFVFLLTILARSWSNINLCSRHKLLDAHWRETLRI